MKMSNGMRCAAVCAALGVLAGSATMWAQDNGVDGPPKVLVINREFTKPGRDGMPHEKTEAGYVAAAKAGKAPMHYLAIKSMSGPDRALFLSGYDSMASWGAEQNALGKMPGTGAALDHAMLADGDLLSATDESVWERRDDLSLNNAGITGDRYMEIKQLAVKPGHMMEFMEMVRMYVAGYKQIPGAHWTVFQQVYGTNSNGFIVITPMKNLAEADADMASDEPFMKVMGESGMKKLEELAAACIDTDQTNLFRISPKMSLPPDAWVTAEPDFWKPKAMAPVKKAAAPPAQ